MNTQAIENLKAGMNDRVSNHYEPLKKIQINLAFYNLMRELNGANLDRLNEIHLWSHNVFTTGNIACNLNIILQNQNLALLMENEKLKEEVKSLKAQIEWK